MHVKKIILIPSYEPDQKLIDLLKKLSKEKFEIIVVDDGSGLKYKEIFEEAESYAKVISYKNNKGKGYALKTGFKYIKEKYVDNYTVVTMDSDGQHTIIDAKRLLDYATKNKDTLVLGKRLREKKIPLRSKLGNSITRFIYRLTTGLDIYDTQTGLRAFSNKLIDLLISIDGERFEYEMKMLLICAKKKIPMKELEIETIYIENNSHSHFNTFKDSFLVYKEIIKFSLFSIISFIIDFISYTIFIIIFDKLILSNLMARIISASLNYKINRKEVFNNDDDRTDYLIKYMFLNVGVFIINTLILKFIVINLLVNKFLGKLITEIILFILILFIKKILLLKKEKKFNKIFKIVKID